MKLYIYSISLCLLVISSCNNRKNKAHRNKQSEKEMVIPFEFEGEVIGIVDGDTIDVLFEETSVRMCNKLIINSYIKYKMTILLK